jgi:hypothetical protein
MERVEIRNIDKIPQDKLQYFYKHLDSMIKDYKIIKNTENAVRVIIDEWPYMIVEDKITNDRQVYLLEQL